MPDGVGLTLLIVADVAGVALPDTMVVPRPPPMEPFVMKERSPTIDGAIDVPCRARFSDSRLAFSSGDSHRY